MADGPAGFPRDFSCPAVLGIRLRESLLLATGLLPPTVGLSRPLRLTNSFVTLYKTSHNPQVQVLRFRLLRVRSPLLTESLLFSLPRGTEMFQFPRSASSLPMNSVMSNCPLRQLGSPIRKSPDQRLLTASRGVSWFATSFFGSWRLGILRVLLLAYPCIASEDALRRLPTGTIVSDVLRFSYTSLSSFQGTMPPLFIPCGLKQRELSYHALPFVVNH